MREISVDNFAGGGAAVTQFHRRSLVRWQRQIFLNYVQFKRRVQPPDMEK